MLLETNLKNMSLSVLYDLMAARTEEYRAVRNLFGNYQAIAKDIHLLKKVLDLKNIKPIK
jgi:hypothetical protein